MAIRVPFADVPNSIENAGSGVAGETLCGISEAVNRRGGGLTVTMVLKGGLAMGRRRRLRMTVLANR
jgi:hypothetical protein